MIVKIIFIKGFTYILNKKKYNNLIKFLFKSKKSREGLLRLVWLNAFRKKWMMKIAWLAIVFVLTPIALIQQ